VQNEWERIMPNELDPVVGQWYLHRDKGAMFRVVAVDASSGGTDIQNFDGDVEEIEIDTWREMDIETAEPPEDWTGPFDDVEPDDLGYTETGMAAQDWRLSLETAGRGPEPWQDPRMIEDLDESAGPPEEFYLDLELDQDPPAVHRLC
jgi:uncharacterized protein DUF6763